MAVQVQGRAEEDVTLLLLGFFGDCCANLADQVRVPGGPESSPTRKARRGYFPKRPAARAVRPIGDLDWLDAEPRDGVRSPGIGAADEHELLIERHLGE